jgi:hypothetical protein
MNDNITFTIPLNTPNKCGIVYNEDAMKTAVDEYLENHKGKVMLGCLNPEMSFSSTALRMANVSHQITELSVKNGSLYGKAILLDTPKGKIVQELSKVSPLTFAPSIIGHTKAEVQKDGKCQLRVIDCSIVSIDII